MLKIVNQKNSIVKNPLIGRLNLYANHAINQSN